MTGPKLRERLCPRYRKPQIFRFTDELVPLSKQFQFKFIRWLPSYINEECNAGSLSAIMISILSRISWSVPKTHSLESLCYSTFSAPREFCQENTFRSSLARAWPPETDIVQRPPLKQIVDRAAHLRCPNCGLGGLFQGIFRMLQRCPECGLSYFPEQGYYLGAMIINYAATTTVVVALFLISLLFRDFTALSTNSKITLWIAFAITLSLLLMRHAYSFWLGVDFWIKPRQPDAAPAEKY